MPNIGFRCKMVGRQRLKTTHRQIAQERLASYMWVQSLWYYVRLLAGLMIDARSRPNRLQWHKKQGTNDRVGKGNAGRAGGLMFGHVVSSYVQAKQRDHRRQWTWRAMRQRGGLECREDGQRWRCWHVI
jgi:hypothetical protein